MILFNFVFEVVVGPAASPNDFFRTESNVKTLFCHVLTDSSTSSELSMFLWVQLVICGLFFLDLLILERPSICVCSFPSCPTNF